MLFLVHVFCRIRNLSEVEYLTYTGSLNWRWKTTFGYVECSIVCLIQGCESQTT